LALFLLSFSNTHIFKKEKEKEKEKEKDKKKEKQQQRKPQFAVSLTQVSIRKLNIE
jgi:hypothetical protein